MNKYIRYALIRVVKSFGGVLDGGCVGGVESLAQVRGSSGNAGVYIKLPETSLSVFQWACAHLSTPELLRPYFSIEKFLLNPCLLSYVLITEI